MDMKKKIVIIIAGCLTMMIVSVAGNILIMQIPADVINRPSNKDGNTSMEIEANVNGEKYDFDIKIKPKKFTEMETIENFFKCYEIIMEKLHEESNDLSQVKSNLNLIKNIDEYGVTIEWYSSNYKLIDSDGVVYNDDFTEGESQKCTMTAKLKYELLEDTYNIDICVCQKNLSDNQKVEKEILQAINGAEADSEYEDSYTLPNKINGKDVIYRNSSDKFNFIIFPILGIVAVVAVLWDEKQKKIQEQKRRNNELIMDYAEVVSKLTLLAGAGMSIRSAWEKIVFDYREKRKLSKIGCRAAYEEMEIAYNSMKDGKSEISTYEMFGTRCNTREYMKLGTILGQNVKKGSRDVLRMLEEEVEMAFEKRKNHAIQLGEEAGTKLLFPMIMMLLVVMAVVMVPAIMTLNF